MKKPGDSALNNLDLQNAGSLAATTLTLAANSCVNSNAAGELFNGTGLPCNVVQVYVQEWDDAIHTTPIHCWYGGAVVSNTCDFSNTSDTLAGLATASPLTITGGARRHERPVLHDRREAAAHAPATRIRVAQRPTA